MVFNDYTPPILTYSVLAPSPGEFSQATFTVNFTASNPLAQFRWVQLLIAAASDGGGHPFCFVHFDVAARELWLFGDEGSFVGPARTGQPTDVLQNSFCAVNSASTRAAVLGPSLVLGSSVIFKRPSPVPLRVFLRCEMEGTAGGDWVATGGPFRITAWNGEMPAVVPTEAVGMSLRFALSAPDPATPLGVRRGWLQFLVAASPAATGEAFCFLHIDYATSEVWIYSSEAGAFLGPATPGEATDRVETNACKVTAERISTQQETGMLEIEVSILMKEPMIGPKNLYLRTLDPLGRDSGWIERGHWRVC